jgi:AraC-like DNA-binding protein
MKYYTIPPPVDLADAIQFFWVLEGTPSEQSPFLHRALADCGPELIFYYKGCFDIIAEGLKPEKTFDSGIYGQSQCYKKLGTSKDFGIFGAYLYPYTLTELFSASAAELTNQSLSLKVLCNNEGALLEEMVMSATDTVQRIKLVSNFIRGKLKNKAHHYSSILQSIRQIIHVNRPVSIAQLASDCHLSGKQFERKFRDFSGLSPKAFVRLARFTSVIKNYPKKSTSLTSIALACGYYDQSHFIHDFRGYSGYSPNEYFRQTLNQPDHRASVEFKS